MSELQSIITNANNLGNVIARELGGAHYLFYNQLLELRDIMETVQGSIVFQDNTLYRDITHLIRDTSNLDPGLYDYYLKDFIPEESRNIQTQESKLKETLNFNHSISNSYNSSKDFSTKDGIVKAATNIAKESHDKLIFHKNSEKEHLISAIPSILTRLKQMSEDQFRGVLLYDEVANYVQLVGQQFEENYANKFSNFS